MSDDGCGCDGDGSADTGGDCCDVGDSGGYGDSTAAESCDWADNNGYGEANGACISDRVSNNTIPIQKKRNKYCI